MSVTTLDLEQLPPCLRVQPSVAANLWLLGNRELMALPLAAVVGTRDVSTEGIARTKKLTALLVREGFCVVSGLAQGVDTVAHRTALEAGGRTIAVMGTPIDDCYPRENAALKAEIAEKGLVISQFAPGTRIHRANFPQRNVLMAAMSCITFVVEAGVNSGTRHQVKAAVKMGKRVAFLASLAAKGFPWISDALRSGLAVVIESPEDAVALLRELAGSEHEIPPVENPVQTESIAPPTEMPMAATPATSNAGHLEFDFEFQPEPVNRVLESEAKVERAYSAHPIGKDAGPNAEEESPSFWKRIWKSVFG